MMRKRVVGILAASFAGLAVPALAASASVELAASGGAVAGAPVTITASGTAEAGQLLFVEVESPGGFTSGCQTAFPGFGTKLSSFSGDAVSAGPFAKSYTYTPPASGSYRLCGYLDKSSFETPAAMFAGSFSVADRSGSLSVAASPGLANSKQPVTVTVNGTTNSPAELLVGVGTSVECNPADKFVLLDGERVNGPNGDAVQAGGFSRTYTYAPTGSGTYTVCSRLATGPSYLQSIFATGSATFKVRTEEEEESERRNAQNEANARANAQREAEEEARRAAALKRPVTRLSVQALGHSKGSSYSPGYTNLVVTTSPYAHVAIKLVRHGHSTYHIDWGRNARETAVVVPWSCGSPGGVYRYTVSARTNVGRALVRKGRFSPVSVRRCHFLKRREAEARARENREAREGYEREARAERERISHFEYNCRAIGGTPAHIVIEGRPWVVCHKRDGGLIPVPQ